jgi:hypothetical protein
MGWRGVTREIRSARTQRSNGVPGTRACSMREDVVRLDLSLLTGDEHLSYWCCVATVRAVLMVRQPSSGAYQYRHEKKM